MFTPNRALRLIKTLVFFISLTAPIATLTAQNTMSGPAPKPVPAIEGVVVSIEGSTLVLAGTPSGSERVLVQADTLLLGRKTATLASIRAGEAMGVTAERAADGSLTATAINVFTTGLWQRVRKGQWDMDSPGLVMTNAQVDRVVDKIEGRTLYMKYEMLSAAISVPPDAVIRRSVELKLSDLRPGMKVSVRLAPSTDGILRAANINIDLKG